LEQIFKGYLFSADHVSLSFIPVKNDEPLLPLRKTSTEFWRLR